MTKLTPELTFRPYARFPTLPNLDTVRETWTDDQIQQWWEDAGKIEEENKKEYRHNRATLLCWHQVFQGRGQGSRSGTLKWFRDAMVALDEPQSYPPNRSDAYLYRNITLPSGPVSSSRAVNFSPCTLLDIIKGARKQWENHSKTQVTQGERQLFLIGKAAELGLSSTSYATLDEFLAAVNDTLQDKWIEENYPDGKEVEHRQCDGCDTWDVGERRCSCGNRRLYLEMEGDAFKGFYAYVLAD